MQMLNKKVPQPPAGQDARPDNTPPLKAGTIYRAETPSSLFEFQPSVKHPGYWYIAVYDQDRNEVQFNRKPSNLSTLGTRRSVTAVYGIPSEITWYEEPAPDVEPWYVTEPLQDGKNPVTLCKPVKRSDAA
jgi:hypothetical protein